MISPLPAAWPEKPGSGERAVLLCCCGGVWGRGRGAPACVARWSRPFHAGAESAEQGSLVHRCWLVLAVAAQACCLTGPRPPPARPALPPAAASLPFFGVKPVLVDEKGRELEGEAEGYLCIAQSWPSNIRTVYRDHERYETTYFAPFPGYYFSGDGARRDSDGYYWITGGAAVV